MKIIKIGVERVANLGSFESCRMSCEALISEEEGATPALLGSQMKELRQWVDDQLETVIQQNAHIKRDSKGARAV